jgi:hypothetical protein
VTLVVVEHHPSRHALLARCTPADMPVRVVADPDPDGEPSSWRCYQACLDVVIRSSESHAVVIQDDAIPCVDFSERVEAAISDHPEAVIGLFCSHQHPQLALAMRRAADAGTRYVRHPMGWFPTVAVVWPSAAAWAFRHYGDDQRIRPRTDRSEDEVRVARWGRRMGVTMIHTVPSLVEHPDDQPSLFQRRAKRGRSAVVPPGALLLR